MYNHLRIFIRALLFREKMSGLLLLLPAMAAVGPFAASSGGLWGNISQVSDLHGLLELPLATTDTPLIDRDNLFSTLSGECSHREIPDVIKGELIMRLCGSIFRVSQTTLLDQFSVLKKTLKRRERLITPLLSLSSWGVPVFLVWFRTWQKQQTLPLVSHLGTEFSFFSMCNPKSN